MTEEVHGHEVIQMMATSGEAYTRETLVAAIIARFGESTRFHTCAGQGMTADALVSFLEAVGKFTDTENDFTLDPAKSCDCETQEVTGS